MNKVKTTIVSTLLLSLAMASPLGNAGVASANVSAQAQVYPSSVAPVEASSGAFVDRYQNNVKENATVESNPALKVLSGYLELWTPGKTWDGGTVLNQTVLDANIQKVVEITTKRTEAEGKAAYLDDRRNQSYSVIDGLGPLADVYRQLAGAKTTILDIPADATEVKYDDKGTGEGDPESKLGNMVKLVKTLRGNYSSTNPSKGYYQYPRPFRWSEEVSVLPTLVPAKNPDPTNDGGFPSGHTNAAYLAAIAMAYAVPERYQELLTRASDLGHDRIVAGMHSPLDVMGGRVMATALSAAILNDPENQSLKEAAYQEAHTTLLNQVGTGTDPYSDYESNKQKFTERLTYDFPLIHEQGKAMTVPEGAEVLLETRLPYLDDTQRRWVLATTGLPSGYPLLDDEEGWGRLNLFAAADGYGALVNDVTVTMDAAKGGFHAADQWRNDISGYGKLIKQGTGTLELTGNNTFLGGVQLEQGTLIGSSATAWGNGHVVNNGGILRKNVPGELIVSGNFKQTSKGTLELALAGSDGGPLRIKGTATYGGKLRVDLSGMELSENQRITVITSGEYDAKSAFASVEVNGLPAKTQAKTIYNAHSVQLLITKK